MSRREVLVLANADSVAREVAMRLDDAMSVDIAQRDECHVCLTGGTVGIALLRHVGASRDIDWSRVHFWWGDERFVETGSPERNEGQAWDALLERISVPAENIHRIPSTNDVSSLDEAALTYAAEIAEYFGADFPHFDVTLLGVGPDAHVASLFPHQSAVSERGRTVVPVRDSPKPPPERVSLTMSSINASRRVWIVAAGADKADAVAASQSAPNATDAPVSVVQGEDETMFFFDEAAASRLTR